MAIIGRIQAPASVSPGEAFEVLVWQPGGPYDVGADPEPVGACLELRLIRCGISGHDEKWPALAWYPGERLEYAEHVLVGTLGACAQHDRAPVESEPRTKRRLRRGHRRRRRGG